MLLSGGSGAKPALVGSDEYNLGDLQLNGKTHIFIHTRKNFNKNNK